MGFINHIFLARRLVRKSIYLVILSIVVFFFIDAFLPWTQRLICKHDKTLEVLPRINTIQRTHDLQLKTTREVKLHSDKFAKNAFLATRLQAMKKRPNILLWPLPGFLMRADRKKTIEFTVPKSCGGCTVTSNRSTLQNSLVVVLFISYTMLRDMDIPDPKTRIPEQYYVFWNKETPAKLTHLIEPMKDQRFDPIFNLTWMFFSKSDIRSHFGTFRRAVEASIRQNFTGNLKTLVRSKKKVAVWVVSNCDRLYGAVWRMQYARKLQEAGLKLDKFGECFKTRDESKLVAKVQDYKFYLSFENSLHCPEYLTEKFWRNGLEAGLVPIVWGPTKADVEAVAPKNSYIHAEDFETPQKLVDYIRYLNNHDDKYLEYHKWRETPLESIPLDDNVRGYKQEACRLCRRVVVANRPPQTIPSISEWFYGNYPDDRCLVPSPNMTEEEKSDLVNF